MQLLECGAIVHEGGVPAPGIAAVNGLLDKREYDAKKAEILKEL